MAVMQSFFNHFARQNTKARTVDLGVPRKGNGSKEVETPIKKAPEGGGSNSGPLSSSTD